MKTMNALAGSAGKLLTSIRQLRHEANLASKGPPTWQNLNMVEIEKHTSVK